METKFCSINKYLLMKKDAVLKKALPIKTFVADPTKDQHEHVLEKLIYLLILASKTKFMTWERKLRGSLSGIAVYGM